MADTVDVNAQGDAVASEAETKVVEENTETVTAPVTSTDDADDNLNKTEESSADSAAVKRKADDTNSEDVDESKKSKVDDAVAADEPSNGHTEKQPTAEEAPAVESTEDLPDIPSKTVEDVERLKASAEENVAA